MSAKKRIFNIFTALMMLVGSLILAITGKDGFVFIIIFLTFWVLIKGIHQLTFYFTMAKNMVGGIRFFYEGIFLVDIGLFAMTIDSLPNIFSVFYLLFIYGFYGVVDILRSLEEKKMELSSWKVQFTKGLVMVIVAVVCLFLHKHDQFIVWVFSAALFVCAIEKIAASFKKTAIIFIDSQV